jgi:uncharacterized protein
VRVWIDLANSPHPPLFGPIADELERGGHTVLLTARDNAQTVELARARWNAVEVIGGETPAGLMPKAASLVRRVVDLRSWAREHRPSVALSHNSYAQIVAARSLGMRVVTAMDYEHQPSNHLAFRLANRILLPQALPLSAVARQGGSPRKVRFYPGLKEEIALRDFRPDGAVLAELGIDDSPGAAIVVTRPPPARAVYHRHGNDLYAESLQVLGRQPHVRVVVLPRHDDQRRELAGLGLPNMTIPEHAVDARSLMYRADLVIGAGGTMTREAAILGAPTLTAFAGEPPAVDLWLERRGALRRLTSPSDVADVRPRSSAPPSATDLRRRGGQGVAAFVEAVDESARGYPRRGEQGRDDSPAR